MWSKHFQNGMYNLCINMTAYMVKFCNNYDAIDNKVKFFSKEKMIDHFDYLQTKASVVALGLYEILLSNIS